MRIEKLFFELIQVAIGTRKTLDRQPTSEEWASLFEVSKKQALMGICFAGIKKLPTEQVPPIEIISQFLFYAAKIQQRNQDVSAACAELVTQYAHSGIQCCILKGQGNLENYPVDLRECRTPGDIDVWCKPLDPSGIDIAVSDLDGKGAHYERYHGKRAVIEYVMMLHRIAGTKPHEGVRYHHIDAPSIGGVEVEAHFRPLFLDSPLRNRRLQRWSRDNEQFGLHEAKMGEHVFPIPTAPFNAVYQLCHIYRHLFDEGIGLRQLLDYYFVLKAFEASAPATRDEVMHTLSRFGLSRFASAVMFVLAQVFEPSALNPETQNLELGTQNLELGTRNLKPGTRNLELGTWNSSPWMLCSPDEKEGRFLLNEIMQAGNFGKYDTRIKHGGGQLSHAIEKTKHNLRLLTHYPEEVLWEPWFRLYHWTWRKLSLWRF